MKKFSNFRLHRRRFIVITVSIFFFVTIAHLTRVVFGWDIIVDGVSIPQWISLLAVFISGTMTFMGMYYIFANE